MSAETKTVEQAAQEVNEKLDGIKAMAETKAEKQAVEAVQAEVNALSEKTVSKEDYQNEITKLTDILEQQGKVLKSMESGEGGKANRKAVVIKALNDHKEAIKNIAKGENGNVEIKALTNRAAISDNDHAYDLPDIGQLATREISLTNVFPRISIGTGNHNGTIRYYDWDEATTARAAAMVAEGASFPESTAKWKTYTLALQKIGDTIPVTEELLEDAAIFAAELQMFLDVNVQLTEEDQIANGDGTGTNLKGLLASIGAYTAAASSMEDPNVFDLAVKVREAIVTTGGSKYRPNVILANTNVINRMKLKKADGMYVMPPFVSQDGTVVDSMTVIECNILANNTMVVGDRRFARIYDIAGVQMSQGHVGTQFTQDEMTLKIRKRLAFLIRNADAGAFLKVTDIDAALTTLGS